jgi:hypothetical protein
VTFDAEATDRFSKRAQRVVDEKTKKLQIWRG